MALETIILNNIHTIIREVRILRSPMLGLKLDKKANKAQQGQVRILRSPMLGLKRYECVACWCCAIASEQ